ncbi:MAG: PhzF family phenazine biosynthesis protein [Sphingomonadales bacterium]|nr:PhzF family phenazine biosynthesis protein [Sphingomonadales bacterium]
MPVARRLKTVDVFTAVPLLGNPVAVVLDGDGLDTARMQAFAAWTNLSETTFVLPATSPEADYALRIFTPVEELPFAGHPTLGSAHAVIEAGIATPRAGRLVQQCAAGLVEIDATGPGLSFRLPRAIVNDAPAPALDWLGGIPVLGPARAIDVGPVWLVAQLADAGQLATLAFDRAAFAAYQLAHGMTGTTLFALDGDGQPHVRSFFWSGGAVVEDPVCGSGNAAVAVHRIAEGQAGDGSAWTATQGRQIGRDGRVMVRVIAGQVHVGGECVTCVDGLVAAGLG